jgi:hypothetical protein
MLSSDPGPPALGIDLQRICASADHLDEAKPGLFQELGSSSISLVMPPKPFLH